MRAFTFWNDRFLGKELAMTSIAAGRMDRPERIVDAFVEAVQAHDARLLIIDGLFTIGDLQPHRPELRVLIHGLAAALAPLGCTALLTSPHVLDMRGNMQPEFTMCDGLLELSQSDVGSHPARLLRVWKMRGQANMLGQHALQITTDGLAVYPRTEGRVVPEPLECERSRVSSGAPELDAMLGGGFPRGTVSVLAGAPGTGKTQLGMQYLAEGVRKGERCLFFGFRESAQQLQHKARAVGVELGQASLDGKLTIVRHAPVELSLDKLTADLATLIEAHGIQRLVIDTIGEIENCMVEERRAGVMAWWLELLRARGVTALLIRQLSAIVGPELDFSDSPLELLGENVILLRYVEYGGALNRILSVLKMRDTAHDRSIRQYEIDGATFRVLPAFESGDGLLTSIAKLPSERRVKRGSGAEPNKREEI